MVIEADGELVGTGGIYLRGEAGWGRRSATRSHPGRAGRATRPRRRTGWRSGGSRWGAPRVHLFVDVRNTASQAIAVRAGFVAEGTVRSCLEYRDGTRGDAVLYGRLAGD